MADNGRTPDLDAVARSDRLLDALAAGQPPPPGDPADRALADLLAGWRDETRWPPATGLVAENQAVAALERGRRRTPHVPPHSRRGLALVGTVAATVLGLGGFGAVLATAQPGDALYGLRSTLFGEPPEVRDDRVALVAQTEFAKVQQMIHDGQWDQAKDKLAEVSDTVQNVNNADRKQELLEQWNELNVKVEHRDPEATVPPAPESDPAVPPVEGSTSVTLSTDPDAESSSPAETTGPSDTSATSATSEPSEPGKTSEGAAPSETETSADEKTETETTTAPTETGKTTAPPTTTTPAQPPAKHTGETTPAEAPRAETPATTVPAVENEERKAPTEPGEHATNPAEHATNPAAPADSGEEN
ncbi:anti-sigma-D factor RsdA [Mycolicibacillus trivialis]